MKPEEYRAMLSAVEMALKICEDFRGEPDERHRQIVKELTRTRSELNRLLGATPKIDSRDPAGWIG